MDKDTEQYLKGIDSKLHVIQTMMSDIINAIRDAESEIPEKMRRFMMYMHDMHDIKYMYEELGLSVPSYITKEVERCDDRLRQLLKELHTDTGAFERVRQKMAGDEDNRYDHTRQLFKPKEPT